MTEEPTDKSLLDYGFEHGEDEIDRLTELGLSILRQFVEGRHIEAKVEGNDLVLYTVFTEGGVGGDVDLGRINLYHVAGYTADHLADCAEGKALSDMASLFHNIGTLIDQYAIPLKHPAAYGFNEASTAPQIGPYEEQDDAGQEDEDYSAEEDAGSEDAADPETRH
jgi:hypothetical protein